jgi:aminopeptidase-like protein
LTTPRGLAGGYEMVRRCVEALEGNFRYKVTCFGEPCLGKRGLFPTLSHKGSNDSVKTMMNFLAYADGNNDLVSVADLIGVSFWSLLPIVAQLKAAGVIVQVE